MFKFDWSSRSHLQQARSARMVALATQRIGRVLAVSAVIALTACSGSPPASNPATVSSDGSTAEVTTAPSLVVYPFDEAFKSELGASGGEIWGAVLLKRGEFYTKCMNDSGYEVSPSTFQAIFVLPKSNYAGKSYVQVLDESIARNEARAAGQVPTSGPSAEEPEPSPTEKKARFDCLNSADSAVPNPNDSIDAATASLYDEAAARAQADPATQAANAEVSACVAQVGHPIVGSPIDTIFQMIGEAEADLTKVPALRREFDAIRPCLDKYEQATDAIDVRVQQQKLDEDPTALSVVLSQHATALDGLSEQLKQVQSD